ncbi:MAG: TlpA family protein disulfide reductase [Deltaproteobacteria bacterium]|nr:TlpA family protein disulfide reductase [Deltaproteobacteria bacterium]
MMRRMYNLFLKTILFFIILFSTSAWGETKPMGFAIPFPDLRFSQSLSKGEQTYLGISRKREFSFREIKGDLILVELISTYCINCQRQAPIFTELHSLIEKDPALKGKVKMLGIAAGNNPEEAGVFKQVYQIPYPILSDPKFNIHMALGGPRTPFTIWVRKDAQGKGVVVSTHLGLTESADHVLAETRAVLQYNLALLKPKKGAIYEGDALMPPLPEEELLKRARKGMEASGGKVLQIDKITLKDGDSVYAGRVDFGTRQENLFSKLTSRRAVCDVCHDTFFIYTFDAKGIVVDIVPVQLTKIDNLTWTEEDLKKLKSRTIGKSILKPFLFNPGVDSVSGATITAVLIFDSLDKGKAVFEKLKKEGYVR